jgi:hypothetical protein
LLEAGIGSNKIITFENIGYKRLFCAMARKTDKVVFHQIKVIDAGAKEYQ